MFVTLANSVMIKHKISYTEYNKLLAAAPSPLTKSSASDKPASRIVNSASDATLCKLNVSTAIYRTATFPDDWLE